MCKSLMPEVHRSVSDGNWRRTMFGGTCCLLYLRGQVASEQELGCVYFDGERGEKGMLNPRDVGARLNCSSQYVGNSAGAGVSLCARRGHKAPEEPSAGALLPRPWEPGPASGWRTSLRCCSSGLCPGISKILPWHPVRTRTTPTQRCHLKFARMCFTPVGPRRCMKIGCAVLTSTKGWITQRC